MSLFAGVKVLDVSHVLAGPFCSYQLALLGADVLKVENPKSRDMIRFSGPDPELRENGLGPGFLMQNAGKRSIALDLKDERGRGVFRKLAAGADIVIENFRPGRMAQLGLSYDDLKTDNAKLIYCSITGFGQDGPLSQLPAYDHVVQGISGMMAANATDDGQPWRVGFPLIDYNVGLLAAFAVAGALYERSHTGVGRYIDVAMLDAALITMGPLMAAPLLGQDAPVRRGKRAASGSPFSGLFETSEGILTVAANTPAQARSLAAALDRADLVDDPRFAQWGSDDSYVNDVQASLTAVFAGDTAVAWEARLADAGVPASKVRTVGEVLQHDQVAARGLVRDVPARAGEVPAHRVPGPGFRTDDDGRGQPMAPPPRMGEHSRPVLSDLGYSAAEIEALFEAGVIG
jgi:crotonobetainyl-CoA:carnitine CoA-transferase CaiB-like acyl-CoA transferase